MITSSRDAAGGREEIQALFSCLERSAEGTGSDRSQVVDGSEQQPRQLSRFGRSPRAFSSEVDTGSRKENALEQRDKEFSRFRESRKYSRCRHDRQAKTI